MGGMTKPVKISFVGKAGDKVRKPTGKLTEPVKISFLGYCPIKKSKIE